MRCAIELDFSLVEEICYACQGGELNIAEIGPVASGRVGPLLELLHIDPAINGIPIGREWLHLRPDHAIVRRLGESGRWYATDDCQGIIEVSKLQTDQLAWVDFVHRIRRGGEAVGFSSEHCGKIAAGIGEIYDNVIEHSGRVDTGYVAYHARSGELEFTIADKGVGVLESLRTNPKYANLSDAGTALERAMELGVSRLTEPGRGTGLVSFFTGLANISREIRLRSGDHGRIFVRDPKGSITATTRQLPECPGLFCAVLCDIR